MEKRCSSCKEIKSIENFSRNRSNKDGYKEYCKQCAAIMTAKYREKHIDEINERKRAAYHNGKLNKEERTRKALEEGVRKCSVCGIVKPISEYYKRGDGGFYQRCKACEMEAQKRFSAEHAEAVKAQKKMYNIKRKSLIAEYNHKYYVAHKNEVKQRVRDWESENPERMRDHSVMYMQRKRHGSENIGFTIGEWIDCKKAFTDSEGIHCAYCWKIIRRPTQDHFISLERGGKFDKHNIIPACRSCNSSKASRDAWEWYEHQSFYSDERKRRIIEYLNDK